jgi:hypothetical protein
LNFFFKKWPLQFFVTDTFWSGFFRRKLKPKFSKGSKVTSAFNDIFHFLTSESYIVFHT